MTCCKNFLITVILSISRTAGVSFMVLAVLSILNIRQLLSDEYKLEGSTYFIPFVTCEPSSVQARNPLDGLLSNSTHAGEIIGCSTLDWMVNAVALSLVISGVSVLLYIVLDLLPGVRRIYVSGMALFVPFGVSQAVVATWALNMSTQDVSKTSFALWSSTGLTTLYGIETIRTYANSTLLWATGAAGCAVVVMSLVEFVLNLYLDDGDKKKAADKESRYIDDDGISRDDNEDIEDGFKSEDESSVNAAATKSTTSSTRTPLWSSA